MSDKLSGVEASAIGVLKRAVTLDTDRRFTEALVCYQEGIQLLIEVMKVTTDTQKKQTMRGRIEEYMGRAEQLKEQVEKEKQDEKIHEQIHIENNATGYSYPTLFSRCVDQWLTEVQIEDPYIRSNHQVHNLLRFCEFLVKCKAPVKRISLLTGRDTNEEQYQQQRHKLSEMVSNLKGFGVTLCVQYSDTLHDREIRFNNGWIVKIGRGFDYFKPLQGKFCVGYWDFDMRPCHATTVDIFHSKQTQHRDTS